MSDQMQVRCHIVYIDTFSNLNSNFKFPEYLYTFDRACDEIRMEIQTENFFRNLTSTRLKFTD